MTQKDRILNDNIPNIRPGSTVKVYQIIKEAEKPGKKMAKEEAKKEKIQIFDGLVLARKHGKEPGATITVRKVVDGIGVERIFPLHSPTIKKIEIVKQGKVRRAKLYYLRSAKGKRARLKSTEFVPKISEKKPKEIPTKKKVEEKKALEIKSVQEKREPSEKD